MMSDPWFSHVTKISKQSQVFMAYRVHCNSSDWPISLLFLFFSKYNHRPVSPLSLSIFSSGLLDRTLIYFVNAKRRANECGRTRTGPSAFSSNTRIDQLKEMKSFSKSVGSSSPTNSSTSSESTSSLLTELLSSSLDKSSSSSLFSFCSRAAFAFRRTLALSRWGSLQPFVLQTPVLLKSGHSKTWRSGQLMPFSQ